MRAVQGRGAGGERDVLRGELRNMALRWGLPGHAEQPRGEGRARKQGAACLPATVRPHRAPAREGDAAGAIGVAELELSVGVVAVPVDDPARIHCWLIPEEGVRVAQGGRSDEEVVLHPEVAD